MLQKSAARVFVSLILALTFVPAVVFPALAAESSQGQSASYPAKVTIGSLSFSGRLARMDAVSEEEKKKAVEETLKELGITQESLDAAQEQIEKTAQAEQLTPQEVDAFMDGLLGLLGVDNPANVWEALFGEGGDGLAPALEGLAEDEAKGKLADAILDKVFGTAAEAAGTVLSAAETLVKAAILSVQQYQKDKEKWANRAAAAIAERMLRDFNEKLNEKLRQKKDGKPGGWVLSIQGTTEHYFSFFGISGNLQIWIANLRLEKYDHSAEDEGPGGVYNGMGTFNVEYEMSTFDDAFIQIYVDRFRKDIDAAIRASGMNVEYKEGDSMPTKIKRMITVGDCSATITAGSFMHGESTQPLHVASVDDQKEISVSRGIELKVSMKSGADSVNMEMPLHFEANNNEDIAVSVRTVNGEAKGPDYAVPLNGSAGGESLGWDPAIWEIWDQDKKVIITMP